MWQRASCCCGGFPSAGYPGDTLRFAGYSPCGAGGARMPEKITKRLVDGLEARDGKEATVWDTAVTGFGIRVRPGGAKTYVLHYRAGTGRGALLRKVTIGRH